MNTSSTHRPTVIGGVVLLLALGAVAVFAFRSFAGVLASLNPQVALLTGIAVLVVWLSAARIARTIKRARNVETIHPMSSERGALYDRMLKAWTVLIAEDGSLADEAVKKLKADLGALETGLALLASPEVIRSYLMLRAVFGEGSPPQAGPLRRHLGQLMVAMRKDLVSKTPDLNEDELLAVVLEVPDAPVTNPARKMEREALSSDDLRPRISLAVPN